MIQPPQTSEHLSYYSRYIDLVQGTDLTATLEKQIDDSLPFLRSISEQKSLHRYQPASGVSRKCSGTSSMANESSHIAPCDLHATIQTFEWLRSGPLCRGGRV